jgi:hypothetical protein
MIPELNDGVLPGGVHDCTATEVEAAFGRFQKSDRRMRLTEKLLAYLADARRSGIVTAVLIDGSYVTAKDEPEDIDLIVVVRPGLDPAAMRPFEYNATSKWVIRKTYQFDAFPVEEGSDELAVRIAYFSQVNPVKSSGYTTRTTKGLLRVLL